MGTCVRTGHKTMRIHSLSHSVYFSQPNKAHAPCVRATLDFTHGRKEFPWENRIVRTDIRVNTAALPSGLMPFIRRASHFICAEIHPRFDCETGRSMPARLRSRSERVPNTYTRLGLWANGQGRRGWEGWTCAQRICDQQSRCCAAVPCRAKVGWGEFARGWRRRYSITRWHRVASRRRWGRAL